MTMASSPRSAPPTAPPTVPPSSTAGTYFSSRDRKITFASKWYFKPEGVRDVKKRFEAELRKKEIEAQPEWNNTEYAFRVRCLAGEVETISPLFLSILRTIVKEEGGDSDSDDGSPDGTASEEGSDWDDDDDDKPLNSNKIENLAIWTKQHRPTDTSIAEDEELKPDLATSFPDTIRFYKFRKTWSFPTNSPVEFDVVVPDGTITELSRLTNCKLATNFTEGLIYIGSHSEEACLNAISKLDNILKLSLRLIQPYMNHLFYSEEADDVKFTLRPLVDVKKAYFETTLLGNLDIIPQIHDYINLHETVMVRLAPFDRLKNLYIPIKNLKFEPAVSAAEKDVGTGFEKQWVDFKFCATGDEANNPLRYFSNETGTIEKCRSTPSPPGSQPPPPPHSTSNTPPHSTPTPPSPIRETPSTAKIEQWASEIPVLGSLPSNQPPGPAQSAAKKAAWDTYNEYKPEVKPKKEIPTNNTSSVLAKNLKAMKGKPQGQALTSKQNPLPAPMIPLQPVNLAPNSQPSSKIPPTNPLIVTPGLPEPTSQSKPARPVNPDFVENADGLVEFFNYKSEHSLLDDNVSIVGPVSYEFNVLEPAKKSEAENSNTLVQQSSVVHYNQQETLQAMDEVATRTFHNTMNQMAPKPKPTNPYAGRLELPSPPQMEEPAKVEVADPLPEFVQMIEGSFAEMMKETQGFRGKIVVQAEFGRVLLRNVKPSHLTTKERDHPLDAQFLHTLLIDRGSYAPFTFFTNVVTRLPADVQYLIEMKDKSGNDLWEDRLFDWKVSYEFFFQDRKALKKTPFTIEIDGETFDWKIKTRRDLGNLYISGTKRHWDVRISAIGYEINCDKHGKYGELASAIETSLYIPPHLRMPAVYVELEDSLSEKYELDGVRVNRISRYKSKDEKSILELRECRDLDVDAASVPGKPRTAIAATSYTSEWPAYYKLQTWEEVSILSAAAEEVLEANTRLELGEEADWNLSDVKAAEAMYLPALEMLKQMDGVGSWNLNGVDVRTNPPPSPPQPQSQQKYFFW